MSAHVNGRSRTKNGEAVTITGYFKHSTMAVFGRAVAITVGVLVGGGVGFYLRETFVYEIQQRKKKELQKELEKLSVSRSEKERLLEKK